MSTSHSLHGGSEKADPNHTHQVVTTAQLERNNLQCCANYQPGLSLVMCDMYSDTPIGLVCYADWCATSIALWGHQANVPLANQQLPWDGKSECFHCTYCGDSSEGQQGEVSEIG